MPDKATNRIKRPRSEKQLANDEKLRKMAVKRREEVAKQVRAVNERLEAQPSQPPQDQDVSELIRQIKEANENIAKLQSQINPQQAQLNRPQVGMGGMVGTFERYITDPNFYPNPIERLAKEPRLARFAFNENYELSWEVALSQYETVDHVRTKEPRFVLKLIVKMFDDVTGELTNKRFVILQGIFHEDPEAAIEIARANEIEVDTDNEKQFLDEMRYLRFRDWLIEAFFPTPPPAAKSSKEVVIGNKLVTIYEVNSENSESMANFFASNPKKG